MTRAQRSAAGRKAARALKRNSKGQFVRRSRSTRRTRRNPAPATPARVNPTRVRSAARRNAARRNPVRRVVYVNNPATLTMTLATTVGGGIGGGLCELADRKLFRDSTSEWLQPGQKKRFAVIGLAGVAIGAVAARFAPEGMAESAALGIGPGAVGWAMGRYWCNWEAESMQPQTPPAGVNLPDNPPVGVNQPTSGLTDRYGRPIGRMRGLTDARGRPVGRMYDANGNPVRVPRGMQEF